MAPSHLTLRPSPLSLQREFVRKALHLAAAVFPVAYAFGLDRGVLLWVLAAASAIALLVEWLRRTNTRFAAVFDQTVGFLTRPDEQQSITGATWLALSCLLAVTLLSRPAAIAALWCATAGDPAATIAGRLWTNRRDPHEARKTLAGSFACALVSFAGAWLLAGCIPVSAVAIAATAAAAEAIPVRVDDNIRVIFASGAIAQFLV